MAMRACLPEARGAARLRLGPDAWHVDGTGTSPVTWRPHGADSGLPAGAGTATATLYLLARVRRIGPADVMPDARRALDLLALAVLAETPPVSMRDEHRTIVAVGMPALSRRPGLRALCATADVPYPSANRVALRVVPRLDAVWRAGGLDALARLVAAPATDAAERAAAAAEVAFARWRGTTPPTVHAHGERTYDAEVPLATLTPGLALAMRRLEPYGIGNPEPLFLARGVRVDGARLAGDPMRPYQRLRLRQDGRTVRAVATGSSILEVAPDERFDVLYAVRATPGGVETRLAGLRPEEVQAPEIPNKTVVS
ncbi:MAG: hypothetical protein KIT14_15060 [bacterium]|nr:hypothetical protein [bacterium]